MTDSNGDSFARASAGGAGEPLGPKDVHPKLYATDKGNAIFWIEWAFSSTRTRCPGFQPGDREGAERVGREIERIINDALEANVAVLKSSPEDELMAIAVCIEGGFKQDQLQRMIDRGVGDQINTYLGNTAVQPGVQWECRRG